MISPATLVTFTMQGQILMEINQRTITTGGFDTFFHETGAGNEQTLLLLHGSGPGANAISNWQFALPFLGENYHCL
ncbi:MAG: hypothetical protein KUG54_00870, partial [Gammaproteobacteria bacterium]|nr:hypothetical protein [Gammaproteobacteria bacterium]